MCQIFCYCIIQGVSFKLPSAKCEVSSLGLELLGLGRGLVSKFEPGLDLGLGGYSLDYITVPSLP